MLPTRVVHIKGRSFGEEEQALLQQSDIPLLFPPQLTARDPALLQALRAFSAHVSHCYVHVDLDVLDATRVGRANTYPRWAEAPPQPVPKAAVPAVT